MRKALEVKPYYFYNSFEQMKNKVKDNFVLIKDGEIIGAVTCYGNEKVGFEVCEVEKVR